MIPIFDSKRQYAQIGEEAEKAVCRGNLQRHQRQHEEEK